MSTKTALTATTPLAAGFRQPAEWDRHEAVWLAWPSHQDLWGDALGKVRTAFTAFASAIADVDPATGRPRGERLEVLVPDAANEALASSALVGLGARLHRIPFGDIWLRDTAPVFLTGEGGARASVSFAFNGWGGKYVLPHDDGVSARIAEGGGGSPLRVPGGLRGGGRRGHVPDDAPVPPAPEAQPRDAAGGDRGGPQGRAWRHDRTLAG